jgi:plasmid maintenance system antidote protein VapI
MALTTKQKSAYLREFGQNVEIEILKKFKNKEEFLRQTGFYRKTLHDIITGTKDTHISTVYKLAKVLDISPREFWPLS